MDIKEGYIDAAVALPVYQTFTYAVPPDLVPMAKEGKRVLVPFGRRQVAGYVLRSLVKTEVAETKKILDVLDEAPLFPSSMVPFFQWIADYYIYPIGLVIKSALPGGLNTANKTTITITDNGRNRLRGGFVTPMEKTILLQAEKDALDIRHLNKKHATPIPKALIMRMIHEGLLSKKQELRQDRVKPRMEQIISLNVSKIPEKSISKPRKKIIDLLRTAREMPLHRIKEKVPGAARLIKAMTPDGYVQIEYRQVFRDPFGEPVSMRPPPKLTPEQQAIVSKINNRLGKGFDTFLLVGVTGSGKTEIYLQLAMETIRRGLSVLVLVPEIALISQMERRFRSRFGDQIAVLHSGLSQGERYDQWQKIIQRKVRIAIGARSAIFSPFDDLGLIVVDEEHDTSYKQESALRYNARDLAIVRAKQLKAVALLGSATPSIQSYHNAAIGKYAQVQLTKRVQDRSLPDIEIVDLCGLRDRHGHRRFLSDALYSALRETVDRGEQAILFLNRRGFANLPLCASCGKPLQCKNCDIALTYHKKRNAYLCHYCGFSLASSADCPSCGSSKILHLGLGTEKIESTIASLFPNKTIQRMDRDTIRHKGAIVRILRGLKNQSIDILIGTQLVAKGHDFPNITLVGIICADLSLNFPDFRAGEQTFQLLAQVSGRAGRGERPGKVILQTYNPEHFSIVCAKNQDIQSFYQREIAFRKSLQYPPYSRMIQFVVSSKDRALGTRHVKKLATLCHKIMASDRRLKKMVTLMGPAEAPFAKIASNFRWQILLKSKDAKSLHSFVHQLLSKNPALLSRQRVKITIDVDPVFMM